MDVRGLKYYSAARFMYFWSIQLITCANFVQILRRWNNACFFTSRSALFKGWASGSHFGQRLGQWES